MADETLSVSPAKTKAEAKALGLQKYFTGRPCKRGHLAERYTKSPNCIECLRLAQDRTQEERREYHREYGKRYYADPINRAKRQEQSRKRDAERRKRIDPNNTGYALDDAGIARKVISRAEAKALKLPRYFTGKRCKNGHVAERYTKCGCVTCARAYGWVWNSDPANIVVKRFRTRERAKKRWRDPIAGPRMKAQKEASRKRHAKKWRHTMLHKLAGSPKPSNCEVCGSDKRICFDHCHATGLFRGWICNTCNSLLGIAKDSPALLRSLAEYLEQDRSDRAAVPSWLTRRPKNEREPQQPLPNLHASVPDSNGLG